MGRLKLYDTSISREIIAEERAVAYNSKSPREKWDELFALINLSIELNGGQALKKPQEKVLSSKKQLSNRCP